MTQYEFNHAVQLQYRPLRNYAIRLVNDFQDANDLVQETMLRAFRNRDKFMDGTNLRGWLYTIMKNIFINQYRRVASGKIVNDDTESQYLLNSSSGSVGNKGEDRIASEMIFNRIDLLSEKLKIPFLMSYKGYKYEEIASHLSIPLGTVKIRIHLARKKLQKMLMLLGKEYGLSASYSDRD